MKKLVLALAVSASTSIAQANDSAFGVTVGGAESGTSIGVYVAETKQDGFGWYADIASNFESGNGDEYGGRYSYYDWGQDAIVGDPETGKGIHTFSAHIGGTRSITDRLYGYAGVGFYSEEKYTNYYDPYRILGDGGNYHAVDEDGMKMSVAGGVLYNLSEKVQLKTGVDTGNANVNFGIGIRF